MYILPRDATQYARSRSSADISKCTEAYESDMDVVASGWVGSKILSKQFVLYALVAFMPAYSRVAGLLKVSLPFR